MGSSRRNVPTLLLVLMGCTGLFLEIVSAQKFQDFFEAQWGEDHLTSLNDGAEVELVLDLQSGAGFQSKSRYTYGFFSIDMKLIPDNSAGTVTAYYLSSGGSAHDEVDFEFLGNQTGQPYILQTNVFANGVGEREQRIFLWFDPSADFHTYAIVWNHAQIIFLIDNTPIRIYRNLQSQGVDYPSYQQAGAYTALFDGSSWATQGGRVPIDWNSAPFVATYSGFQIDACINDGVNTPACATNYQNNWWEGPTYTTLSSAQVTELLNVRKNYLIYDYCTDRSRYPTAPTECASNYGT